MSLPDSAATGWIFHIQRHSTEDGPGLRTTVFFKGCPMQCPWCHNPEGMQPYPELVWYDVRCIGFQGCLKVCPRAALEIKEDRLVIRREQCDACGDCVPACPAQALEVLGRRMTVAEVIEAVLRDRVFYEKSGGGVTLSGGEPSRQPGFATVLMKALRKEGIHLALDTCAGTLWSNLRPLIELADLVLLDLKHMEEEKHLQWTGLPLQRVLENARRIATMNKRIWVRTPIIPGYTDTEENIRAISRFIRSTFPTIERYELLAFTNVPLKKYERLDRRWALAQADLLRREEMEWLTALARKEGVQEACWSGITRMEG